MIFFKFLLSKSRATMKLREEYDNTGYRLGGGSVSPRMLTVHGF